MAHVSASGDSIASLFISVRIGFEPCNNRYLALSFCMAGPGYLLLWHDIVFIITAICLLILSLVYYCSFFESYAMP